jgi:hypothetical protein
MNNSHAIDLTFVLRKVPLEIADQEILGISLLNQEISVFE